MYEVDFYETDGGFSQIREFIRELERKSLIVKDARIQYEQVSRCINMLQENGTAGLSIDVAKHIEDEIWELRPGRNRVFLFYYRHGTYVLLHCYTKKTSKTPRREIERAKYEMNDYIRQKGR